MSYEDFLITTKVAGLLLFFGLFLGILGWLYRPGSKPRFQADAMIPFRGDERA